jgi:hypothetical protein
MATFVFDNMFAGSLFANDISNNSSRQMLMELDSEPNIIDVNSDITTNQIWTANNIYRVTSRIDVQALLVIEPGTMIYFGYASGGINVNNGGTLISKGTPSAPIIYTCDCFYPPDWGYYCDYLPFYGPYHYGISVSKTASPATTITYSFVEGAIGGIVTNNITLDNPIENNYLFGNIFGIGEYGPRLTDIKNNLWFFSDYSGIEVYLADTNGVGDANSAITIENNTCNYELNMWQMENVGSGIYIHGVMDANQAGTVMLLNNIVSRSYNFGLHLCDPCEYVQALVYNTGYYSNSTNMSWEEFPDEFNPVETNDLPYNPGQWPLETHYLKQGCPFINKGLQYIEQTHLIGMTTDVNGTPDSNFVDIGFHYPNWDYSNAGTGLAAGDFNRDTITDYNDLCTFASLWLDTVTPGSTGDLDNDANVNFIDYALFAASWKKTQGEPNIVPTISGDPNTGYVDVGVSGFAPDTQQVFVFADGRYLDEIYWFANGGTVPVDISALGSGTHQFKIIVTNTVGKIISSQTAEADFAFFLANCAGAEAYDLNEPYHFCANYSGSGDISVKVYDRANGLVWSQTYSPQNVNGSVPVSITSADDLGSIMFAEASSGEKTLTKLLTEKFDPAKNQSNIRALIIVPSRIMGAVNYGDVAEAEAAFKARGIPYKYLGGGEASYKNLSWYGDPCFVGKNNAHIEYIYYTNHGGYKPDPCSSVLRTAILLSDGVAVSGKKSDWPGGVGAPAWMGAMSAYAERKFHSIEMIAFPIGQLKFVHFDCCFTGHLKLTGGGQLVEADEGEQGLLSTYMNDMSWALGMFSATNTQIYQGWWNDPSKGGVLSKFNLFSFNEWNRLKNGDSFYDAISYAINPQHTPWVPDGPQDNYRLMGALPEGTSSMQNLRLR